MNHRYINNAKNSLTAVYAAKNTGLKTHKTPDFSGSDHSGRSAVMRNALLAFCALIALLFNSGSYAQDKTAEIDKIFSWATPSSPGCVCAVSQNGKEVVNRAYGAADLERNVPLSPNSIFDAGSLTKQFVAAAALLLVEEGRLSLSDDVRKYLPQLPDYGHNITIDHLLTHTSGLRDWTGILPLTSRTDDALTLILRQRSLNHVPGEEWFYTNSGYVLLKEIIARTSGMSFAAFTRKRLFEPLGMQSTSYREDMREVIKNRALAYDRDGDGWKMAMLLDNNRGGGGIFSTAGDLLRWNEALTNKQLGAFVTEKIQEPARLNNGRKLNYARGLFIDSIRGTRFWWHSGSADGYKSVLGRFPEQGLSISILCNSGDNTDRVAFASRIFDLLAPATAARKEKNTTPPIAAEGVDTASLNLKSRTGLFFNETTNALLQLVVDRNRLRIAGGPALVAVANDRFKRWGAATEFMSGDAFEVHFLSQDEFALKSMEGKTVRYRRARPYAPKPHDLKAFAGRYESEEAGTVFRIEPKGESLLVRLEHAPNRNLEMKPVHDDTFQTGRMLMRFQRNKAGVVVALDYSNPVVRNIRFTRKSESTSTKK
jgi:CubicO group peptidase (beta-lactamase class C family)